MITTDKNGFFLLNGKRSETAPITAQQARKGTIAAKILAKHDTGLGDGKLKVRFDAMVSHDITYVGIIQTARASGLQRFPVPYALTNCHNSLCAVGGTINEDDHLFGLSAAKKYGGIYVPANQAVIHQYARECLTGCGKMLLGSDSHTRYGALGVLAMGEGGPELVKQLLGNTYDINTPEVIYVELTGAPVRGVGPHDVALALIGAVFADGFAKNKILEFGGSGIASLSVDFRNGIDVMTTETACLSSIWQTDEAVHEYYAVHNRENEYKKLSPEAVAYYDGYIHIALDKVKPMIALPFHPSNAFTIREFIANAADLLNEAGKAAGAFGSVRFDLTKKVTSRGVLVDQGIIAGCAGGTFENICSAADILRKGNIGTGAFSLSVYPSSTPVESAIFKNGIASELLDGGAVLKPAFCGPCFGAGDVPANNCLSIRHTTRNFPSREGSKPSDGQLASVALMDARSIAATAANGGVLTPADEIDYSVQKRVYTFNSDIYERRVYNGVGKPMPETPLIFGPNITDWPKLPHAKRKLLVRLTAVIRDEVTTTDELIPSGETSSYRSNPLRLAEFALSRREPQYVARCKQLSSEIAANGLSEVLATLGISEADCNIGSAIFANKPGDGSAREQAASCQRVLGGAANICKEFATKRYRSNCINWGMLPLTTGEEFNLQTGDYVLVDVFDLLTDGEQTAVTLNAAGERGKLKVSVGFLTAEEKRILMEGCLINYYAACNKK